MMGPGFKRIRNGTNNDTEKII